MRTFIFIIAGICISSNSYTQEENPIVSGHELSHRLIYLSANMLLETDRDLALDVITRAANSCYTGVIFSDVKLNALDNWLNNDTYMGNFQTFIDSASQLGLKVYPTTANFGYSSPILSHDPNLAEGLPVIDARFEVVEVDGELVLMPDESTSFPLLNLNFEEVPEVENDMPGWSFQDDPGVVTFWDSNESYSGDYSLRIEDPTNDDNNLGRIIQQVTLEPYKEYHLNFWIKSENMSSGKFNVFIINKDNDRHLQHNPVAVASTQEWTSYDLTFNSLEGGEVNFVFGVYNGGTGKVWLDNISVESTAFNNIIRRSSTPVVIETLAGQPLSEGMDINSIVDPLSGNDPYPGKFSVWHEQPTIGIPEGSSLTMGDIIKVSYYHTATIGGSQVCASLTEPGVFDIVEMQMNQIRILFQSRSAFSGWMLGHDEIRVHNWDESPAFGSPGENLAYNIQQVFDITQEIDVEAEVFTWNDMFDRYHNADPSKDPYYLVKDSWEGSWEGLDPKVTILNWRYGDRVNSTNFFSELGNKQVLAGYYDQGSYYTADWLEDVEGVEGIIGVMYTTWVRDYSNIEDWADATWGGCAFATSLPIELGNFEAELVNRDVVLNWSTLQEWNNDGFYIERRIDNGTWSDIDYIEGAGESSEELIYSYVDTGVPSGIISYRLRQVDVDGSESYSEIEIVNVEKNILSIPSIIDSSISIDFNGPYQIINIRGQVLDHGIVTGDEIRVENLPSGHYILQAGNQHARFVKVN